MRKFFRKIYLSIRTKYRSLKSWYQWRIKGIPVYIHVPERFSLKYDQPQNLVRNPLARWPRNAPCFCQSGKKFKKCHMDITPNACTGKASKKMTPIVDQALKQWDQSRTVPAFDLS